MNTTVRDFVLAQPGLAHVSIDDDRRLLRKLIETIGVGRLRRYRWAHVRDTLGHGSSVSQAICRSFGLDPDEYVGDSGHNEEEDEGTSEEVASPFEEASSETPTEPTEEPSP